MRSGGLHVRARRALHPGSRSVAVFAVVSFLSFDVLFSIHGGLVEGSVASSGLLDGWGLVKAALMAGSLGAAALRARSVILGSLAAVFMAIGMQDETGWHFSLAGRLVRSLGGSPSASIWSIPAAAWAEFVILMVLALLAALVVWALTAKSARLREARRHLTLLLAGLFFFAVIIDLLAAAEIGAFVVSVEELGERIALSVAVGYGIGLLTDVFRFPTLWERDVQRSGS